MRFESRSLSLAGIAASLTIVVGLGGAIVLWSQRDFFLPEVAAHWGSFVRPDVSMPFVSALTMNVMITTTIPLFLIFMGLVSQQIRQTGPVAGGLAVFFAVLLHGALWQQRGLTPDAVAGLSLARPLGWAVVGALAVALAIRMLGRRWAVPEPVVHRGESGLTGWAGRTRWSWLGLAQVGKLGLLVAVNLLAAWLSGSLVLLGLSAVVGVVVFVRAPFVAGWLVVSAETVVVRGMGGFVWFQLPIEEVERASVVSVVPRVDFGGLGRRVADDGTLGLLTGAGRALRIDRMVGAPVVVSLARPEPAAEAINLLAQRWRG